ncbi:hypothetical protein ElyMa_005551700, partial [Elysia marginata]
MSLFNYKVISETTLGTIESVLPHCDLVENSLSLSVTSSIGDQKKPLTCFAWETCYNHRPRQLQIQVRLMSVGAIELGS